MWGTNAWLLVLVSAISEFCGFASQEGVSLLPFRQQLIVIPHAQHTHWRACWLVFWTLCHTSVSLVCLSFSWALCKKVWVESFFLLRLPCPLNDPVPTPAFSNSSLNYSYLSHTALFFPQCSAKNVCSHESPFS